MIKTVYYLGTCSTCNRIMGDLRLKDKGFTLREIKSNRITEDEIEDLKNKAGNFESIFTRKSMSFKKFTAPQKASLTEIKIRSLILKDYTFLKRPVIIYGSKIFAGNSPKIIALAKECIK